MSVKNRVCLWFNGGIAEAARFYCETFPDTRIDAREQAPAANPSSSKGEDFTVSMTIMGVPVLLLNGGPHYPQTEAFSFMVETADQAETDRYWHALTGNGGTEGRCGWCKDRWGLSWQIIPRVLHKGLFHPEAGERVQKAMMGMNKIDVATIEAALKG